MPVHECALGIFFPRPDMERVEGRQSKAIRSCEVVEDLSRKLRRSSRMLRIPRVGDHEVVSTGQFATSVRMGLVEDDLRVSDVDETTVHQVVIYVVETHCPEVISADATEFKAIALVLGYPDIFESFGGVPNHFEKGALLVLLILRRWRRVRVNLLGHGAQQTDVRECERNHSIATLSRDEPRVLGESENLSCIHWNCLLLVKSTLILARRFC